MIVLFACGGVTLKIADYYGEKTSNLLAYLSASISALIFGLLLANSPTSSAIILGIILGVLFSGKINQLNLFIGLTLSLTIAFILTFQVPLLWLLVLVTLFAFIDEWSHDWFSSKRRLFAQFFLLRPLLKILFLVLVSLSLIELSYLIAFFCFDLAYDLTTYLLNRYHKT